MKKLIASVALGVCVFSSPTVLAAANTLEVIISGVRNDAGNFVAVLCQKNEKFPNSCKMRQIVKAEKGVTRIKFHDLSDGNYAFAAFHDENENERIDMSAGYPSEGLSFGNNAMGRFGSPAFDRAAVEVKEDKRIVVRSAYLKR